MIPIYEAIINDQSEGIFKISLVDLPAVESDFLTFKKQDLIKYSIQNEEQRIVYGVLMRADFNIYRYSKDLGEFYIRYSKETIKKMAEKLMLDGFHNNINLQHQIDTEGVNLIQIFIKDEANGVSPKGFEDIEDGSLFAVYKINNEKVWRSIKEGIFKGFSLEGYFEIKPTKLETSRMKKLEKLKKQLLNILMEFGEIQTDKGTIYWSGDEEIKPGDEVYKEVDGEKQPLENGEYTLTDGRILRATNGVVESISEPETPEEEAFEEETEAVETPSEDEDVKTQIESLWAELNKLKEAVNTLQEVVNELLSTPLVEPVAEEFEKVSASKESKLSKAVEIASALRK